MSGSVASPLSFTYIAMHQSEYSYISNVTHHQVILLHSTCKLRAFYSTLLARLDNNLGHLDPNEVRAYMF